MLLLMAVGLMFVYGVLWPEAPMIRVDSTSYLEAAQHIRNLEFDVLPDRPPGYPLFLVLHGVAETPNRVLFYTQIAMCLVAVFLVAAELRKHGISFKFIIPFVIVALLPYSVEAATYVMSEVLAQFLLAVGMVCLSAWLRTGRWWLIITASLALSMSGIARPTYQVISVALCGLLLFFALLPALRVIRKRLVIGSVGLVASWGLIIGGLLFHNHRTFDFFGLTPYFGYNLSTRTATVLNRLPGEYSEVREILIHYRNQAYVETENADHYMYIWRAVDDIEAAIGLDHIKSSKYMGKLNMLLIRKAPLFYLMEVANAAAKYWLPAVNIMAKMDSRLLQAIWGAIHFLTVGLLWILSAGGIGLLLMTLRIRRPYVIQYRDGESEFQNRLRWVFLATIAVLLVYNLLISCLFEVGNPRYRQPTDLLMLAAIAILAQMLTSFRITHSTTEAPTTVESTSRSV